MALVYGSEGRGVALAGGTCAWMRRHRRRTRAGRTKVAVPIHAMNHPTEGKWPRIAAAMAAAMRPANTKIAQSRSRYCQSGRRLIPLTLLLSVIRWLNQAKSFVPPAEAGLPFMGRLEESAAPAADTP